MTGAYTQPELEAMMADLESELVERKEAVQAKEIRQAVCAFANDLSDYRCPGVVFVGARDDGTPTGLKITDRLLLQLADIKTDGYIVPPPTLSVTKQVLAGAEVVVMTVRPSDSPPVRYRGRIWIRVGSRRVIASAQDERILNEKRRYRDPHFDAQAVITASMSDLDLRRFEEEYLPRAVDRTVIAANERSIEERLAGTKMVLSATEVVPTVMGILVLGIRPQDFIPGAYTQFLRIAGTEWGGSVVDEARCDGPLLHQIRCLDQKLIAHNRTSVDFKSRLREQRRSTYPLTALQQLTYNGIMHRTYEGTNASVRVYWFDDRIEIISPGGGYGAISADNFGQPGIVDYRNPNLAEAMRVLGLVQRYGFGIPSAIRALRDNGQSSPEFRIDPNWVFCTVRAEQ